MKKEIAKAGNSIYNAGGALIGVGIVMVMMAVVVISIHKPETLKNALIAFAVLNLAMIVYAGSSLLGAGKALLNLDESSEDSNEE